MSQDYRSHDQRRKASCDGRIAFETPELAARVSKRRIKTSPKYGAQRPYKCNHCGLYHIGKSHRGKFGVSSKGRRKGPVRLFIETELECV